jgi:DNA-binding LytR/AlgR family response regulator
MDGFELISQAKKIQPDMPVLVMTGYGSMENAIQALHEGVDGLIIKPFENSAKLVQTVQRVLEESRQRRNAARLQALRPLFDVTERLLAETSPHALEKLILNSVTGLFQAVYAEIYRMGVENAVLEVVGVSGKPHSASGPLMQQDLVEMAIAEGSPVLIVEEGHLLGVDLGELAVIEEAGGRLLPTSHYTRWTSGRVSCT